MSRMPATGSRCGLPVLRRRSPRPQDLQRCARMMIQRINIRLPLLRAMSGRPHRPKNRRVSLAVPNETIRCFEENGISHYGTTGITEQHIIELWILCVALFWFLSLRYYGRRNYVDCYGGGILPLIKTLQTRRLKIAQKPCIVLGPQSLKLRVLRASKLFTASSASRPAPHVSKSIHAPALQPLPTRIAPCKVCSVSKSHWSEVEQTEVRRNGSHEATRRQANLRKMLSTGLKRSGLRRRHLIRCQTLLSYQWVSWYIEHKR